MAYCRGTVYVYNSSGDAYSPVGNFYCHSNLHVWPNMDAFNTDSREVMLAHLKTHREELETAINSMDRAMVRLALEIVELKVSG